MIISLAMGLPSRYAIGSEVLFHPNTWELTSDRLNTAFPARIEKVQFSAGKVTYDLAIQCMEGDDIGGYRNYFYDAITIKDVDSTFVTTPADVREEEARTARIKAEEATFEALKLTLRAEALLRGNPIPDHLEYSPARQLWFDPSEIGLDAPTSLESVAACCNRLGFPAIAASTRQQSGCVVFRYNMRFEYEILLVKSSDGKDWVFPKGGVEKNLSSRDSAAKEVYEEAGVEGHILSTLGTYRYRKQGRDQKVVMYGMVYKQDTADWPEKGLRKRKWFSVKEAEKKLPKILKPFIKALTESKMLALSGASVLDQVADMLRSSPVVQEHAGEVALPDEDTVSVEVRNGDGERLTMRLEDWGQHPASEKLTIHYDYEHAGGEAGHFKHSSLGQVVGHVNRIIARFITGEM